MKQIPVVLVLGFALSLCNLSNKLKSSNSNSPGTTTSSSSGPVEKAELSAAQAQALAGGDTAKWEAQGMSWSVPAKWTQNTDEPLSFGWRSPGGWDAANLIVSISAMTEGFPAEMSINSYYDAAKGRMKNGEVDEVKWVEIDGLKGVQFREANPPKPDGIRRLQWMAYRKYAGQLQFVNLILSSSGKGFPTHQDEMYGVLNSMKIVH